MFLIFFEHSFKMVLSWTPANRICWPITYQNALSILLVISPFANVPLLIIFIKMLPKSMSLIFLPISNVISLIIIKTLAGFSISQIFFPESMILESRWFFLICGYKYSKAFSLFSLICESFVCISIIVL